jgi:hypothetical protein
MLFAGGGVPQACGWQRQPMPIISHNGKLVTSIDYGNWRSPDSYGIATLSIGETADLLQPENWTISGVTHYDMAWPGSPVKKEEWPNAPEGLKSIITLLEGSVYPAADGRLVNLLRMEMRFCQPGHGQACLLELDPDDLEAAPKFFKIIGMPTGGNSRTHVLRDPVGGKYWAIGNLVTDPETPRMRNVLALTVSDNGYRWRVAKILLDRSDLDPGEVGFQYTSFIFDGGDILHMTRTAINGANSFHDSNCITFGTVKNFRQLGETKNE